MIKYLSKAKDLKNKKVLVRVGVNVPTNKKGNIENTFRLDTLIPTIEFLIKQEAKIILLGHIGRNPKESLKKVFKYFKKKKKLPIFFNTNTFVDFNENKQEELKQKISDLKSGEILLLDNIRATEKEKENDENLAKSLATIADVYVNEAFSVSHRTHMSLVALPKEFEEKYLGFQFEKELKALEKIQKLEKGEESIFILGGAKIATKLPLIDELASKFDKVIIGGAVANNFYKALGYEIGQSVIDKDFTDLSKYLFLDNLFIPNIVIVKNKKGRVEKEISDVDEGDIILDISPSSFLEIESDLKEAKTVFFNGPIGFYEDGYTDGTKFLLEILANENNFFIAGGGNTASAIFELGLEKNVDFISTGGGALIKYISTGKLAALEAFKWNNV